MLCDVAHWMGRIRSLLAALALVLAACGGSAHAFDPFFGLFGDGRPESPAPAPEIVAYDVFLEGDAGDALREQLLAVSGLERLRLSPPLAADGLVRRAIADLDLLTDALWADGYLAGSVSVRLGGERIVFGQQDTAAATTAVEAAIGRTRVAVTLEIAAGPPYRLRRIEARDAGNGAALPVLLPRGLRLREGDLAEAARIRAAASALADRARAEGHPFAKVTKIDATAFHHEQAVDVAFLLAPGPLASFGEITFAGDPGFPESVLRSFVYLEPGEIYSPAALQAARASLSRIEALGSVKIEDGRGLDAAGRLPVTIKVAPRARRVLGAALRYSTRDGPTLRLYWTHRNLFGGVERLRLELDAGWSPDTNETERAAGRDSTNFNGRFLANFLSPALRGSRVDLIGEVRVEREKTETYVGEFVSGSAALRWRVSQRVFAQAGLLYETGRSTGAGAQETYILAGLPLSLAWDETDAPLDATRGFRLAAEAAPFFEGLGGTVSMTRITLDGAAFLPLDDEGDTVLAFRLGLGTILGAALDAVPANRRFFAGGGGSVRGYAFRSLSPVDADGLRTGGLSLFEASLEGRFRILQDISVVPFVDAGGSFAGSLPDFGGDLRFSAGLGVRYHTGIGPIRLDVAFPLDRRPGEDRFAVYIGIGQAF